MIVRMLLVAAIFLWLLAGISLLMGLTPFPRTVENAAVIAGLVPSGLFLMITLAYAMGAVRMADRNALIQQSNAVESLSHISIICLDKTGTLTAKRIQLQSLLPIGIEKSELRFILSDYAASASFSNKTNDAIAQAYPGQKRPLKEEIPFASAYKWSTEAFDDPALAGVYVLGAPDVLMSAVPLTEDLRQAIGSGTDRGRRRLFVKPPTRFWTGGSPLSGDWRYTLMALAMLGVYILLLVLPGLRSLFDLNLLEPIDYLILALVSFVWALLVHTAWRYRWLERFLQGSDAAPQTHSAQSP